MGRFASSHRSVEPTVFGRRNSPRITCLPSWISSPARSPNSPASSQGRRVMDSGHNSKPPRAACARSRPRAPKRWPAASGRPGSRPRRTRTCSSQPPSIEGQGDGGALHGRGTHRGGRKMKRVSTHIEGLDEVLGGGIPEGNVVLVSGAPGTMKTSLTYHILHSSALTGFRGLYVSLEQGRGSVNAHTEGLGYRLDDTHGNLSLLD